MRKIIFSIITVLLFFSLFGCANQHSRGNDKETETEVTININDNKGFIQLSPNLGVEADQGAVDQETDNKAKVTPVTDFTLAQEAGQAITGTAEQPQASTEETTDQSQTDSNNDNRIDESTETIIPTSAE